MSFHYILLFVHCIGYRYCCSTVIDVVLQLHGCMMAAFLNRTLPGGGSPLIPIEHPRNSSSPLQRFVKGKRKINDIFVEIEDYVLDSSNYVSGKQKV